MTIPMKKRSTWITLASVIAFSASGLHADEIKFSDLKEKITINKAPVSEVAGNAVATYAPALEKVMPAVVMITASKEVQRANRDPRQEELFRRMFPDIPEDFFEKHGQGPGGEGRKAQGVGSGVIISADGYIMTNNHVVGDADELKVTLAANDKSYPAELIGADPATDVALIKIEAENLKPIVIGDSSMIRIGDVAMAVGSPLELDKTATLGIISAVGRNDIGIMRGGYENFIQTDAAINRGNSGGPLVDAAGRLIGINTAIQSGMSGGNIGIGFAIPSNMALNIVERLLDGGGTVKRGFLGVNFDQVDEKMAKALGRDNQDGMLVTHVPPGTPASEAGIKGGDLIVGFNGKPVKDVLRLRQQIADVAPGQKIKFDVYRRGKIKTYEVTLGDRDEFLAANGQAPSRPNAPKAQKALVEGVLVKEIDDEVREALQLDEEMTGVVVESVKDNVPAAESGLRPGMVITQIDQQEVTSVDEAYEVVDAFDGEVLLLQVFVTGRHDLLAIPLK